MANPVQSAVTHHLGHESDLLTVPDVLKEVPDTHFYPKGLMGQLLMKYTPDEVTLILADFVNLRETTFAHAQKRKEYLVTAGGPASGKSTLLEGVLAGTLPPPQHFSHNTTHCYIDPDRTVLQHMIHTQMDDLILERSPEASYTKWREASQFIANVLLAIALKEGYAIAHGSTMATPPAINALEAIAQLGYRVSIIHLTTPPAVRAASLQAREANGVIQSTPEDFEQKQAMFLSQLPHYLKYPINFAYRGAMDQVVWAADMAPDQKEPRVLDPAAFQQIVNLHNVSNQDPTFWQMHLMTRAASIDLNLLGMKV